MSTIYPVTNIVIRMYLIKVMSIYAHGAEIMHKLYSFEQYEAVRDPVDANYYITVCINHYVV